MADNPKPIDFIERSTRDFAPGVDVATVNKDQKPDELLFGKRPGTEVEPQNDEFIKWDPAKELDGQRGAFYVDIPNGNRMERFWGKNRTEVTKNLALAKQNANKVISERPPETALQPDMKLPYDPIQRKVPRQPTSQDIVNIIEMAQTDPIRAQEMAFELRTGYNFDSIARGIESSEQVRHEVYAAQCAQDFVSAHKDFYATAGNMLLIENWLKDRKLPVTRTNLEIAYREQKDKLTVRPAATVEAAPDFTPPPPPVSPPDHPALGEVREQAGAATAEEVAAIQTGSLEESRAAIQNVFRRQRSMSAR